MSTDSKPPFGNLRWPAASGR